MRTFLIPILSFFLTFGASQAKAAEAYILGDSIGVGVSMASGLPGLAKNSIAIRGSKILAQIKQTPPGSVAYLSLGTNDAVGSVKGIEKAIDKVVAAADRQKIKLVWLGPPCVIKDWNRNVVVLDEILRKKLEDRVQFVSFSKKELCNRSLRGADGVHFNMKGYKLLWAMTEG